MGMPLYVYACTNCKYVDYDQKQEVCPNCDCTEMKAFDRWAAELRLKKKEGMI